MPQSETLVNGADHADKIGHVVTLKVDYGAAVLDNPDYELITGVLTLVQDKFKGDELIHTVLRIGDHMITLDWDNRRRLAVEISTPLAD